MATATVRCVFAWVYVYGGVRRNPSKTIQISGKKFSLVIIHRYPQDKEKGMEKGMQGDEWEGRE